MITVVTGLPGGGKSLYGVWLLGQAAAAGRICASNIKLSLNCPYEDRVVYLDDDHAEYPCFRADRKGENVVAFWQFMPPGVLYVIDEADNYWDSLDFARLAAAEEARLYFKQHAKRWDENGVEDDVVLLVQNLDNLWVRIRRMCQMFVECEFTYRSRPLAQKLPIWMSSYVRTMFAAEPFTERTRMGEDHFSYSEGQQMFGWYRRQQLIGQSSNYNWKGVA